MTVLSRTVLPGLLIVSLLIPVGCDMVPFSGSDGEPADPKEFVIDGTVVLRNVEGGCWTIVADNDESYMPSGLPSEFREDGLPVRVEATEGNFNHYCQTGDPIQIHSIERR